MEEVLRRFAIKVCPRTGVIIYDVLYSLKDLKLLPKCFLFYSIIWWSSCGNCNKTVKL